MSKNTDFEEIPRQNITWWKPTKTGDSIQGIVKEIPEGTYGKYIVVEDKQGETFGLPSHKILQSYIPSLQVGDLIKVEFVGFVKKKNGTAQDYKVSKAKK